MIEAFVASTALVALAEMGDKTQLLVVLLAARFRQPGAIIAGVAVATVGNHFLAASVGAGAAALLQGAAFNYAVAASFVLMGLWTLIPSKIAPLEETSGRRSAFTTTMIAFFIVEMGDKAQFATIALGARYGTPAIVTAGSTLGILIADVPAIFLSEALLRRVQVKTVRAVAAALFVGLGLWLAAQTAGWFA